MPDTDQVATYLAEVKRDLIDGAVYPHRVMKQHAPRLRAAVEAALAWHEPISSGGRTACTSCDDGYGDHQDWPCPEYLDLSRALLGEGGSGA